MVGTTTITINTDSAAEALSHSNSQSDSYTDGGSSSGTGVHGSSPTSRELSDPSDLVEDDWVYSGEIEPSESASRPRSRYRTGSRPPSAAQPPRRHSTTGGPNRRKVHRVVRHPAPRPPSSVEPLDDYPSYGRGYPAPHPSAYGGGRPPLPGYAQSSYSAGGGPPYATPFGAGALTHYAGGHSHYPPYPPNPFAPTAPVTSPGGAGYFHPHHGSGHSTPGGFPGHEMVPYPHHHPPGYPGFQGFPPPGIPPHMGGYYPQWPGPVDPTSDPEMEKKLIATEELMKKHKLDFEAATAALAARDAKEAKDRADAEAAAAAAKKIEDERADWLKKAADEKAEVEKKAKLEKEEWERKVTRAEAELAERLAKEAKDKKEAEEAAQAAKTKAEWEKKIDEEKKAALKKGAEDALKKAEEAKKKEEEAKKKEDEAKAAAAPPPPPPEEKKKPIRFKDAVGRKFSFPFHLCATWTGMEDLIKQAFLHVDVIGPHVQEGHYDLIGPNGEIILPQVWDTMIEPDWAITMTMWPMPEPRPMGPPPGIGMPPRPGSRHGNHPGLRPPGPGAGRGGPPHPGAIPVPPGAPWPPGAGPPGRGAGPGPTIVNMGSSSRPPRRKTEPSKNVLSFFAGGKPKPSGKGKRSKKS